MGRVCEISYSTLMLIHSVVSFTETKWFSGVIGKLWQRSRNWVSLLVFGVVLVTMVAVRASVAMYGSTCFSHDGFMVLDGAWRMLNGQRPHVDFNSMIGPVAYLPTLVGFLFAGNTAAGFGYGQALMGLVLGIWAYVLGSKLYETPRILYALCVAAIAISPGQLGLSPFALTPGATYNRYSYGLLGVLLLECLSTEAGSEFVAGLSTGAVLSLLAFTKITALIVGTMLTICLAQQRRQTGRRWLGIVAGAAFAGLPFLFYLHFDLSSVVCDLAVTAGAKHIRFTQLYSLNSIILDAGLGLLLSYAASALLGQWGWHREARRLYIAGAVVIAASILLIFGNFQQSELPLLGLFFLVISQRLFAEHASVASTGQVVRTVVIGAAAIFSAVNICAAILSLAAGQWLSVHSVRAAPRFEAPALRQFVPVGAETSYTGFVNDGFELLKRNRRAGETVMSLDFTNPFSYGLWIPPAPGGSTNLQYKGSFDEKHKVSPAKLFGAADLVIMPKTFSDDTLQDTVPRIYGPYLQAHFRMVAGSRQWTLYRKVLAGH